MNIGETYIYFVELQTARQNEKLGPAIVQFTGTPKVGIALTRLYQNAPNPFNPATTIHYDIGKDLSPDGRAVPVELDIYDVRGNCVRHLVAGTQFPGRYSVVWHGRDERDKQVPTGIYFMRLKIDSHQESRKMLLLK